MEDTRGMPKTLTFDLTEEEQQAIAKTIKHDKRPEVRQHAMDVRLLHEGSRPKRI